MLPGIATQVAIDDRVNVHRNTVTRPTAIQTSPCDVHRGKIRTSGSWIIINPLKQLRHRQAWPQWSRNHQRWRLVQWEAMLFTDSYTYCTVPVSYHRESQDDQHRRVGKYYQGRCIPHRHHYGDDSANLWETWTNSTCHHRGQFECSAVWRWGPETARFALHSRLDV